MPDPEKNFQEMIDNAGQDIDKQLGQEETMPNAVFGELSDDELKQQLLQRGFELRKVRRPMLPFARPDNVQGKTRISVHLPTELRKAVKNASAELNQSESSIATEALEKWLSDKHLRYR